MVGESRPSRFQGYCLNYTAKGPQLEETTTQIFLSHTFLEESQNDSSKGENCIPEIPEDQSLCQQNISADPSCPSPKARQHQSTGGKSIIIMIMNVALIMNLANCNKRNTYNNTNESCVPEIPEDPPASPGPAGRVF